MPSVAYTSRRRALLAGALVVAAVLAVFGRTIGDPFLGWDDPTAVTENPLLHPPSWKHLEAIWSAPWSGLYIPVSFTVYWLEMQLSRLFGDGPDPRVFHVVLVMLHAGCALLVLRILRRLVTDERAALFGALLFAIHPLQVESAAWITETRGVLATLFGLAALERYIAGAESTASARAHTAGGTSAHSDGSATSARTSKAPRASIAGSSGTQLLRHQALATLFFVLALLAKPTAAAIPLVALVIDRLVLRRPIARALPLLATWTAITASVVLVTNTQQGGASIHYVTPIWARPFVALDALSFYISKLVWPFDLSADYGRRPDWLLAQPWFWLRALPIVALALVLAFLPRRGATLAALALFAAALAPVLGLFAFDFQAISTVADRYAHLALLGPAFALAALVAHVRARATVLVVSAVLLALALIAFLAAGEWRDTATLFRRTLELNPHSHIACVQLGVAAQDAGHRREAAEFYERALALEPGYPPAATNLARLELDAGRADEAIALLRDTVARNPDYPYASQKLAVALARRAESAREPDKKQRDLADAERVVRDLIKIQPRFPGGHLTLAQLLLTVGRVPEAIDEFAVTLVLNERSAEAHRGLAECYAKLGSRALSEEHARAATELSAH